MSLHAIAYTSLWVNSMITRLLHYTTFIKVWNNTIKINSKFRKLTFTYKITFYLSHSKFNINDVEWHEIKQYLKYTLVNFWLQQSYKNSLSTHNTSWGSANNAFMQKLCKMKFKYSSQSTEIDHMAPCAPMRIQQHTCRESDNLIGAQRESMH